MNELSILESESDLVITSIGKDGTFEVEDQQGNSWDLDINKLISGMLKLKHQYGDVEADYFLNLED